MTIAWINTDNTLHCLTDDNATIAGKTKTSVLPVNGKQLWNGFSWDDSQTMKNDAAIAKLNELDLLSLRDLREWVAKQADASQTLKDYETEAKAERLKIK